MVIVFPGVTQRIIDDAIRGNRPELIVPLTGLRGCGILGANWRTDFGSSLTTRSNRK